VAYYYLTQDTPDGNFQELRQAGKLPEAKKSRGAFLAACRDYRVWALCVAYAACFGVELTMKNIAAMYFADYFDLGLTAAGMMAACYGLMNLFARTLGGVASDKLSGRYGLQGRVTWLFAVLLCEGVALMLFSQMRVLALALPALVVFAMFVQMSAGATYSVVPFVNKNALGAVSGIVGAGGNAGAVLAGFLFKSSWEWPTALLVLGFAVTLCAFPVLLVRFSPESETLPAPAAPPVLEPAV
jgi:NNP family nitrate/nitrite transporter-like MFS transporter